MTATESAESYVKQKKILQKLTRKALIPKVTGLYIQLLTDINLYS